MGDDDDGENNILCHYVKNFLENSDEKIPYWLLLVICVFGVLMFLLIAPTFLLIVCILLSPLAAVNIIENSLFS